MWSGLFFPAQVPLSDFHIPSSVDCRRRAPNSRPGRLRIYPPDVDIRRAIEPAAGVRPRTGVPAQRSTAPAEHYKEATYDQSELAHRHLSAGLVVQPNIAIVLFPTYSFLDQRHHPASLAALLSARGHLSRTDRMKQMIAGVIVIGLVLVLPACSNAIDIICPPAGQCPNVRSFHGGGQ